MKNFLLLKGNKNKDSIMEGENLEWVEHRNTFEFANIEQNAMYVDILRFSGYVDVILGTFEVCELSDRTPKSLRFFQNIMIDYLEFLKDIELFPKKLEEFWIFEEARKKSLNYSELQVMAFILSIIGQRMDNLIYTYRENEHLKRHWKCMKRVQDKLNAEHVGREKMDFF